MGAALALATLFSSDIRLLMPPRPDRLAPAPDEAVVDGERRRRPALRVVREGRPATLGRRLRRASGDPRSTRSCTRSPAPQTGRGAAR